MDYDLRRLQDLSADEIQAALDGAHAGLNADRLLEVAHFVERIGGLANARLAVDMLSELENAA